MMGYFQQVHIQIYPGLYQIFFRLIGNITAEQRGEPLKI